MSRHYRVKIKTGMRVQGVVMNDHMRELVGSTLTMELTKNLHWKGAKGWYSLIVAVGVVPTTYIWHKSWLTFLGDGHDFHPCSGCRYHCLEKHRAFCRSCCDQNKREEVENVEMA